jgi:hypothetical protein
MPTLLAEVTLHRVPEGGDQRYDPGPAFADRVIVLE